MQGEVRLEDENGPSHQDGSPPHVHLPEVPLLLDHDQGQDGSTSQEKSQRS